MTEEGLHQVPTQEKKEKQKNWKKDKKLHSNNDVEYKSDQFLQVC